MINHNYRLLGCSAYTETRRNKKGDNIFHIQGFKFCNYAVPPDDCLGEPHNIILSLRLETVGCSKTTIENTCTPEVDATIICVKTDLWSHIDCETNRNFLKENTKLS